MAKSSTSRTLPLVPLPHGTVLLPGVVTRVPLQNRADIAAILANIYSKASTPRPEASSVTVGCVPLNSPYLSPDGKQLIDDGKNKDKRDAAVQTDPSMARKPDHDRALITRKVETVPLLTFNGAPIVDIDATIPYDEELALAAAAVDEALAGA